MPAGMETTYSQVKCEPGRAIPQGESTYFDQVGANSRLMIVELILFIFYTTALSFDDCVEQGGPDCDPKKMWLQVLFCFHDRGRFCLSAILHFVVFFSQEHLGLISDWNFFPPPPPKKSILWRVCNDWLELLIIEIISRFLSSVAPPHSAGNLAQSGLWQGQRFVRFHYFHHYCCCLSDINHCHCCRCLSYLIVFLASSDHSLLNKIISGNFSRALLVGRTDWGPGEHVPSAWAGGF